MPKIVKSGILSLEIGFPEVPPAGLMAKCSHCYADLETIEGEEKARVSLRKERKLRLMVLGWTVPCPECGKRVFFHPGEMSEKFLEALKRAPNGRY